MRSHAEAESRVDHVALAPGSRVGRYEIETTLGQGSFGITCRARDTQLDRLVAIKEYLPAGLAIRQDGATVLPRSTEVAEDFDWGRQRFVEEGRTLAGLHAVPSIVQVFDFIEENGTAYMVMALVQGETLERRKDEVVLQLGSEERQRIQRALSVLGFDTHGFDGAFGPRSREMIASWQRRHGQPPTGYLTADQHKELLREAKPLLDRGVEERKMAPAAQPAISGSFDASYGGSLTALATGGGQTALRPVDADLAVAGGYVTGRVFHPECGALPVLLGVDGTGAISGSLRIAEAVGCTLSQASASGRVRSGTLSLEVRGVDVTLRGTLTTGSNQGRRHVESPDPAGLRNNVP
jgi:peptidoglycan hydrolase-like protein with peptidoglycan-binding domain